MKYQCKDKKQEDNNNGINNKQEDNNNGINLGREM